METNELEIAQAVADRLNPARAQRRALLEHDKEFLRRSFFHAAHRAPGYAPSLAECIPYASIDKEDPEAWLELAIYHEELLETSGFRRQANGKWKPVKAP